MNSIPFCDSRVYIPEHIKNDIVLALNRFPIHPQETIELADRSSFTQLQDPHLATINLTEDTYILFLTTIKGKYYSLFINLQKEQFFYCKFRFDLELYTGTLFTGQFFRNDKESWSFFIDNIHYHSRESLRDLPFSERLELIHTTLKNNYIWDELMNVCHLELKPFFMYYYLSKIQDIPSLKNIYFIPESFSDPIKMVKLDSTISIPEDKLNTGIRMLNFTQGSQPDIYNLEDDAGVSYGVSSVKTLAQSKFLRNYLRNNKSYRGKCKLHPVFNKWMLI